MVTKIIEVTNSYHGEASNWGKFMVLRPDTEWGRKALIEGAVCGRSLLGYTGWTSKHVWVLDLQTGEGACFLPGGYAPSDLHKHKIWVCPMFEPFLGWLYKQDLTDLSKLPDVLNLPDAPFAMHGYRRTGDVPPACE